MSVTCQDQQPVTWQDRNPRPPLQPQYHPWDSSCLSGSLRGFQLQEKWGWGLGRTPLSDSPHSLLDRGQRVCFQRGGEFSGTPQVLNCQSRPHTHLLSLPCPDSPLLPRTVEKKIVRLPQGVRSAGPLCVALPCSVGPVSPQGCLALLVPP